jgi:DNA primase catalytic subunit
MLTYNFSVCLKIRVYWQKISPIKVNIATNIRLSTRLIHKAFWIKQHNLKVICMSQYLPPGMRYSTLEERKQFYTQEFNIQKAVEWFKNGLALTKFALIMGRHTKIFPEKYKKDASTIIIIDEYQTLNDLREQILEFLPEAVYYDRNIYDVNDRKVGQELAFDLDPENITCPIHGSLADKMKRQQGLSFCEVELTMVKQEAIGLYDLLETQFSDLKIVYSGRGFHLHVLDKDAYLLRTEQRLNFAKQVKQAGFHIDEWVTSGEFRLIRLPYSLNGIVSRITLPLTKSELEGFDAVLDKRCLPNFLGKEAIF